MKRNVFFYLFFFTVFSPDFWHSPTEYNYDYKDNTASRFVTQGRLHVKLNHVRSAWHVVQDAVLIPSPFSSEPCVSCFCFFLPLSPPFSRSRGRPTLPLRASDHTAQPWDLSNTAGTSPASPSHSYPPPPPPPFRELPRPQQEALIQGCRAVRWGVWRGMGEGVSIFICLKDSRTLLLPPPSFLFIPKLLLISKIIIIKKTQPLPSLSFIVYASHAT